MAAANEMLTNYLARRWCAVPVHRPDPDNATCSCGKSDCSKPGKHPVARHWPAGSTDPRDFAERNIGIRVGPDSADLADVDLDCGEAVVVGPSLLPMTDSAFGRSGQVTHALYTVPARDATYLKLQDPVLTGDRATIAELRWPEWDEDEQRFKALQTVFPPSLHHSGGTVEWLRDGTPAEVAGGKLVTAVRHVGAAVLLARYAKPQERHGLVLLLANLLVRAGWGDDAKIVQFIAAVFHAKNDHEKAKKVNDGEGLSAVKDSRKRLKANKAMKGLPALKDMFDPALDNPTADKVVANIRDWLGLPDQPGIPNVQATGSAFVWEPPVPLPEPDPAPAFPIDVFPAKVADYWTACAAALHVPVDYVACPALTVLGTAIGRSRAAEVKPGYAESPLFWVAVVAPPGSAKSPSLGLARAPLDAAEARWRADYEAERAAFDIENAKYELAFKDWKKAPETDPPQKPTKPLLRQSVLDDTTTEAARRVLRDNPRGVVVLMDELTGFTRQLNQYRQGGRGADKTFWLSGWNGRGTSKNNRAGTHDDGPLVVSDPFTAVGGMLCPDSIGELREELHRAGAANDGWADRFLLSCPPAPLAVEESWVTVPEALTRGYGEVLEALLALEMVPIDGGPSGACRPYYSRFDGAARRAWQAFTREVAARANALPPGDSYRGVLSKLKHYVVRFACLFHCLHEVCAGRSTEAPVGEASVKRAVRVVWYFEAQGKRCLGVGAPETQSARLLLPTLAGWEGERFSKRELHRKVRGQSAFCRAGNLDAPLKELAAHGYVRACEEGSERGRPSERFAINPLWNRAKNGTPAAGMDNMDKNRESPEFCGVPANMDSPGQKDFVHAQKSGSAAAPAGSRAAPPTPNGFLGMAKRDLSPADHVGPDDGISGTSGVFVHIVHAPEGGVPNPLDGHPSGAGESSSPEQPAPTTSVSPVESEYPFEELL